MPKAKPKLIADTNIFIDRAKGEISQGDWDLAQARIRREYRYCVSYQTYLELLTKLGRGDEEHFQQNKIPLAYLAMNQNSVKALEKPPAHAIRRTVGRSVAPRRYPCGTPITPVPKQLPAVIRAVHLASSRAHLKEGVWVGRKEVKYDLDDLDKENWVRPENARRLEGLRNGATLLSDPSQMTRHLLEDCGLSDPSDEDVSRMTMALDAALRFATWLQEQSGNSNYDYKCNESEYGDIAHLMYLSDPDIHLLTSDGGILRRTVRSHQADRILHWPTFLAGRV
jgi:hypothetical protein